MKANKNKLISIIFLVFIFQTDGISQDTRPYELEDSDRRLNEYYKKIINTIRPAEQIKLKKAQRQWIIFRDLDCSWTCGGRLLDCLIDRTDDRIKQLQETYFYDKQGKLLSIE